MGIARVDRHVDRYTTLLLILITSANIRSLGQLLVAQTLNIRTRRRTSSKLFKRAKVASGVIICPSEEMQRDNILRNHYFQGSVYGPDFSTILS